MPSLLDHLESGDAATPPVPAPAGLVDSVKAEGRRRRSNRHRRNLAVAVLGSGLVALPAVALRPGGEAPQGVNVAADGGASQPTDPVPEVSTTVPDTVTVPPPRVPTDTPAAMAPPPAGESAPTTAPPVTAAPAAAARTTPRAAAATTTTAKPACRNSDDPACGPFRWDPAPSPNQPLVASFTKAPATATVGQSVTFEVTWSDGDARLSFDNFSTDGTALANSCSLAPRYGPWTPPAAAPGSGTLSYPHTFASPGVYKVMVGLGTANCASPYGSDKLVETEIAVT